jgi:transcriptional regulator of acetoin/glycerol metabolism
LKQKKTDLSVSLSLKEEHPLGKAEAEIVIRTLEKNGGSRVKAAEELGISRATLWRKIKRYGLT